MRKMVAIAIVACMSCALAIASAEVTTSDLSHKILAGPDKDGDYLISVKVTVKSLLDTGQEVLLRVQALDAEGFEVFEMELKGRIGAKETRTISDSAYISERLYRTVTKWQMEE